MAEQIKRQVAYKVWISSITNGTYVKQEGWSPNYIEINGNKVSRVNLMATVVSKFNSEDGNYSALTLDDGSDTIRCKAFGPDVFKIKDINIGSIVRFIGKVREYNEETHLSPEVVREIEDKNWLLAWNLELGEPEKVAPKDQATLDKSEQKEGGEKQEEPKVETISDENFSSKILGIIKKLDEGDGADLTKVIAGSKLEDDEAKNIIAGLLKAGDIFEPKKGLLKPLE